MTSTNTSVPDNPPPLDHYAESELPGYSILSQQEFQLEDSKKRPWVWLKVKSRAKDSQQLPLFFDNDTIAGVVEVDFDKTDGAKAITISVQAGVTAVGQEEARFLEVNLELWNSKHSKVAGKQAWPFSVPLPAEATVKETGKKQQQLQTYPLPPNLSERAAPVYIDYRLVVTVKRSTFRVNHTLSTNFAYLPLTRARPLSALRQLAYQEGTPLIGPQGDPEGWKVLPALKVEGMVFNTRRIELECTLAVATPVSLVLPTIATHMTSFLCPDPTVIPLLRMPKLTYALGSPIPIMLTLTGTDEQALDLLATPSAIRVQLARVRMLGSHATEANDDSGRSNNSFTDNHGRAYFWPSDEGAPEPGTRVLQGELEVKRSLKTGFIFPRFSVRYLLALSQFEAPGFSPTTPSKEPLVVLPVTITSLNAAGVVPRSYAPPGYADKLEGDYNTAMGYLENGNQRFLHHHGFG